MNKQDLITLLQTKLDNSRGYTAGSTTRKEADQVLEGVCAALTDGLIEEGEVSLPGLGKLKTHTRAARTGRNPRTGDPVQIPERVAVKFAAGKALEDTLNP